MAADLLRPSRKLANYRVNQQTETCIDANGATHIMAHKTPGTRQDRLDEKADLRSLRDPVCNRELS